MTPVTLTRDERMCLLRWLMDPRGTLTLARVTFTAHGSGMTIDTREPWARRQVVTQK